MPTEDECIQDKRFFFLHPKANSMSAFRTIEHRSLTCRGCLFGSLILGTKEQGEKLEQGILANIASTRLRVIMCIVWQLYRKGSAKKAEFFFPARNFFMSSIGTISFHGLLVFLQLQFH